MEKFHFTPCIFSGEITKVTSITPEFTTSRAGDYMEGYVIDAIPYPGKIRVILNGNREFWVKTTYPIYVITERPEMIMEHPSVVSHYEEEWKTLTGTTVTLHRYELMDTEAYLYISKRVKVVNQLPTLLSQVMDRLGIQPLGK